jgi:hypothetical protein
MTKATLKGIARYKSKGSAPTYIAYHVCDLANGVGYWTRIGRAWAQADGEGFNIQIDIVPLDGCITLRLSEKENSQ